MPKKPKKPKVTRSGKPVPPGVNRLAFAQKVSVEQSYTLARAAIMRKYRVSKATAERDLAEAKPFVLDDAASAAPLARIRLTARLERNAAKAEAAEEFSAVAALSREEAKINGLYAPKKFEVSRTLTVSMRITTLVGVLDAEGMAALSIVQAQIEAARAAGRLPAPVEADPDDDEGTPPK